MEKTKVWRLQVIEPLRKLRRQMKRDMLVVGELQTSAVRDQVKASELAAEKFEQDLLYNMLDTLPGHDARDADRPGLMRANMLSYLAIEGCVAERDVIRPLLERLIETSSQILGIDAETESI